MTEAQFLALFAALFALVPLYIIVRIGFDCFEHVRKRAHK
jgi:hypothetical protein